jgi:membrane protein implicated in regulation of membrane protease activity
MLGLDAWIFWLILLSIFLLIEALTINLTTIWFAIGCLAALILALAGLSLAWQVTTMIVVSTILLLLFILIIRPHMNFGRFSHPTPTNADRLIGQEALVIEPIDPIQGTGQIRALGQTWSAGSINQQPIAAGTRVEIVEIRGVKAIVQVKGGLS